jgi:hypothetical protein
LKGIGKGRIFAQTKGELFVLETES